MRSRHVLTLALWGQSDGYSYICQAAWFIGNIVLLCAGASFLFLLLRRIGAELDVPQRPLDWFAIAVVLGLWPSSTLAYYTFSNLAHTASFASVSLFLWLWWGARQSHSVARWAWCGAAAGLVFLCRWQDILVAAVPLGYELASVREAWQARSVAGWLGARLAFGAALLAVCIPQFVEWKVLYGSFLLSGGGGPPVKRWLTV